MSLRQNNNVNVRVEVSPKEHSFREDTFTEMKVKCDDLRRDILRHCDDVGAAFVVWDVESTCTSCGSRWTEDGDAYNGGCCDADEANNPNPSES